MSHSIHERNLSLTAKGKAKESVHWQLGWWDLAHSLEGTRRLVLLCTQAALELY